VVRNTVVLVTGLLLALPLAACGGDDETSPESLRSRLLPAAEVPDYKVERTFEWDHPADYVVQGLFIAQSTRPSEVIDVVEDAGFEAGAGEIFAKGAEGPHIHVLAAKFGSDDAARDVRDRVHQEDLKQPCYGACSQIQSDVAVSGIPDSRGAQSVPDPNPPPDAPPPFEAFAVEFTVGPYLYIVGGGAEPGRLKRQQVIDAATALYQQVKDDDS
jgi:hypothetical protein